MKSDVVCVGWVIDMGCRYGCWRLVGFFLDMMIDTRLG